MWVKLSSLSLEFSMETKLWILVFMILHFRSSNAEPLTWEPEATESDLYRVIWNSRVELCGAKYGVPINLTQWGIEQNKYGTGWHGDLITLLGGKYGYWPRLSRTGQTQQGGVPFRANLTKHFEVEMKTLKADLPADWHGLGVFDIEINRPLFKQNTGSYRRYKDYSMKLVKEDHPSWTNKQILAEATRLWNEASKKLWSGTLRVAQTLFKNNEGFGYYHFPQCFGFNRERNTCNTAGDNNEMSWLWNTSTALFPSIYFYNSQPNITRRRLFVYSNIVESVRCREYVNKPHMPIYPYSKYNIKLHPTTLYTMVDLINSIGQVADLGVEGIVLWGDSYSQSNFSRCQETKNYMDNLLGPYVKTVKQFVQKCSAAICHSHGRCYTTDPSRVMDETVFNTGIQAFKTRFATTFHAEAENTLKIQVLSFVAKAATNQFVELHKDDLITPELYRCRCTPGFYGDFCEQQFQN